MSQHIISTSRQVSQSFHEQVLFYILSCLTCLGLSRPVCVCGGRVGGRDLVGRRGLLVGIH